MLTLFIYIPSAITMAAISDFFLSLLWGATAILSLVLCQLHCRHPQKQPVAVVVIYILRTFAPKLSIVTLVCVMFADTVDSFNECEMAACHDLHRAPDTPRYSGRWHCLLCDIVQQFWHLSMLGQPPTRICFFYPLPKKIGTCSLQNIYFSYFCLLIISYNVHI